MPPKRKFAEVEPLPAVPPSLPPSVEEAYRRKCVQLKNRTNEVEDANDAARLRLSRIKRQVEKLRTERAFLLEQLAKRTSTNVEDSEGSPSPPPTLADFRNELDANPRKPKDKPLRIKRGHRKSAANDGDAKGGPAGSFKEPASPTSETQSHPPESQAKRGESATGSANGVSKPSRGATSAFDLYCIEERPNLEAKNKEDGDGDANVDEELSRGWDELPEADKDEFRTKLEEMLAKEEQHRDGKDAKDSNRKEGKSDGDDKPETQDEDVEMANYDTEDQDQDQDQEETQMDKDGEE
ncbi:hypothetical protein TOPH_00549 [Tolypocladium ophioglossoides CBS 100239]|uniref:HMG box domain-containing protein n=1 Tax=Tolypocladium ophioglossoides (strain CBS 100239) TaxID=1163406 RepID=A0A0L0NLV4_TOLOC|nr:hypothetical protein TOPH_00549 [Tolypocladium ophioglossoides CBS 100239]